MRLHPPQLPGSVPTKRTGIQAFIERAWSEEHTTTKNREATMRVRDWVLVGIGALVVFVFMLWRIRYQDKAFKIVSSGIQIVRIVDGENVVPSLDGSFPKGLVW